MSPLLAQSGHYRLFDPVDARGVAPRRAEMDVRVRCFHIRKLALYRRFDVSAFDNLIAIARYLAAHSPSERAALQKADIARLLIRGGEPHQEAAASRRSEYEIRTATARRSSQRLTAFAVKAAGVGL